MLSQSLVVSPACLTPYPPFPVATSLTCPGTDYDFSCQTEHVVSLPWPEAEDLARRHETAQALRAASSTAVAAAAAAVGIKDDELTGGGGGGPGAGDGAWRQGEEGRLFGGDLPPPLSPSSPLRPTSRSYDDGARCSPSWGQKVQHAIVFLYEI